MKKNLFLFIAVIAMTSFLSCADKTDEGVISTSKLQIYGQNYALTNGVIWEGSKFNTSETEEHIFTDTYDDMETGESVTDEIIGFKAGKESIKAGNFMISLYEDGLFYNSEVGMTKGKGALLCFHLATPDFDKIAAGKYTFSGEKKANTFTGYYSSLYDMSDINSKPATISSGEVNVTIEGTNYRISFAGMTSIGAKIKGEYFGPLATVNVERETLASFNDITLGGLAGEVSLTNTLIMGEESESFTFPDFDNYNIGLFSTSKGSNNKMDDVAGEDVTEESMNKIDLALFYDAANNSVYFESPIKIRTLYGHDDIHTFHCHTIYQMAPASFTDNDFEKITEFDFDVIEEKVEFSVDNFQPKYVYFKAGNGTKGVIKVKNIKPAKTETVYAFIYDGFSDILTFEASPVITVDLKCLANFPNPVIR